ncbi:MAG: VWA domain-containing protein [Deltaproteobacteria bacterium]|nr:VWA domain-containing protein [Deltaproteobacteria bacterium]
MGKIHAAETLRLYKRGEPIEYSFAQPLYLLLLLFLILGIFHYIKKRQQAIVFPTLKRVSKVSRSRWVWLRHTPFILRCLAFTLLVLAMARPQAGRSHAKQRTEGIDIMLVVDTSGSMKALDFVLEGKRRDRLYVVSKVLTDFINKRHDDRMGMIIFGTHAYAQVPLTLDHDVLQRYVESMEIGMAGESTAIGDAIGVAANRLKDIPAKSKVIILLTDGENTAGKLDPREAAQAAKVLGIKIYAIGVGSKGLVPMPTAFGLQNVRMNLDEGLLKEISTNTDGQYFLASDTEKLFEIYGTIDKLEKTKVETEVFRNYEEKFAVFVWPALCLLLLEFLLRVTRFRRLP